MKKPSRNLEFDVSAFEDLAWWVEHDRAQAPRIIRLIRDIQRDPFTGPGKPEPLKHELKGCWSRRVDQEHSSFTKYSSIRFEYSPADIITDWQDRPT